MLTQDKVLHQKSSGLPFCIVYLPSLICSNYNLLNVSNIIMTIAKSLLMLRQYSFDKESKYRKKCLITTRKGERNCVSRF